MSESKYAVIVTTFDSKQEASVMAKKLLTSRLAACIQLDEVESFYEWEGELVHATEYRLQMKTRLDLYEKLEAFILEKHSFDTPEILLLPIDKISKDYALWLEEALDFRR